MFIGLLSLMVLFSGLLAIWSGYRKSPDLFYIFKPLTTVLILLLPVLGCADISLYGGLIVGGLAFSLLGDIFLMLPGDRFLAGLSAFFAAHLLYISGFLVGLDFQVYWPGVVVFSLAGLAGWFLKDGLGDMKIPAYAYMGAISLMVWLAWSRWISGSQIDQLLGFLGAALFLVSDLVLAINRFKIEFKASRALDLITYYAGQWLIALSVIGLDRLGL